MTRTTPEGRGNRAQQQDDEKDSVPHFVFLDSEAERDSLAPTGALLPQMAQMEIGPARMVIGGITREIEKNGKTG